MEKPPLKKRTRVTGRPKNLTESKLKFFEELEHGKLSLAEAVKKMRQITGKTQVQYAQFVGVAPRALIDLERGVGNPTLGTLESLCSPFGLGVTFRRLKSS